MASINGVIWRVVSMIRKGISQKYRFNVQYAEKSWDALWGISELARYSLITGYSDYFTKNAAILDLGCGEGILQQKFIGTGYSSYVGIDLSDVAIEKAKEFEDKNTHFRVGNLNNLKIDERFDVIIYNESLYYLDNPTGAVRALFNNLNPGGVFIISMHEDGQWREGIWAALDELIELKDRTRISNKQGTSWKVAVYKKRED